MLFLPKYILLSIYFPASGLSCCLWDLSIRVCGLLLHCGTRASLWLYCAGLVALGRDQTLIPCIGQQILNHRITVEVPQSTVLRFKCKLSKSRSRNRLQFTVLRSLSWGMYESGHFYTYWFKLLFYYFVTQCIEMTCDCLNLLFFYIRANLDFIQWAYVY